MVHSERTLVSALPQSIGSEVRLYGWVHRLRMFLLTTSLGKVVDGGNVLLSAVYCVVYVVEASGGKNVSPEAWALLREISRLDTECFPDVC